VIERWLVMSAFRCRLGSDGTHGTSKCDVGQRPVTGLPGDQGRVSLAAGSGASSRGCPRPRARRWVFAVVCEAGAGDGEPGQGEHGQGDVAVPGPVEADLVVVQAGLVLPGLEALLDRPAGARHLHEDGERDRAGRVAQAEGQLRRPGGRPGVNVSPSPVWVTSATRASHVAHCLVHLMTVQAVGRALQPTPVVLGLWRGKT